MLYIITHMWTLKYDTNKLTNETEVDPQTENKLLGAKGEGGEGGHSRPQIRQLVLASLCHSGVERAGTLTVGAQMIICLCEQ